MINDRVMHAATYVRAHVYEYAFGIGAFVILVVALWVIFGTPLRGSVSATLIGEDGAVRAVSIQLTDFALGYHTYPRDPSVSLIAAVPAPNGELVAFVTRSRDGQMHVSVGDKGGVTVHSVAEGSVSVPRWSQGGTSLALSKKKSTDDELQTPESWQVVRAVARGDSLLVGSGYKPFPSPSQRTYALTSQGIALLAYSDSEPTLVVASPIPVPLTTPFAVSQDGMRVAWVAPADRSLQVFENVNGYFVPLLLNSKFAPQSLAFSPNGEYLLGTTHTEATSTVHLIRIASESVTAIGELSGYVDLHTWNYE